MIGNQCVSKWQTGELKLSDGAECSIAFCGIEVVFLWLMKIIEKILISIADTLSIRLGLVLDLYATGI